MIGSLRKEIDKIDDELFRLIRKRLMIAKEIGDVKKDEGSSVRVPEREEDILIRLKTEFPEMDPALIDDIMHRLFKESYSLEEGA